MPRTRSRGTPWPTPAKTKLLHFRFPAFTPAFVFAAAWLLSLQCTKDSPFGNLYTPAFVFTGFIGSDSTVLPGNFYFPDSAYMVADTLRIICYSSYYSQGLTNKGYRMRLDIYSPGHDTLFGTKDVLFRLAQYDSNGFNRTYELTPADSINSSGYVMQLIIKTFSPHSGSPIDISIPYLFPRPYPAFTAKRSDLGGAFTIERARIIGHMP